MSGTTVTQEQEILVNQTTTGEQHSPTVTLLDNDELIVVWEGRGIADDGAGSDVEDTEGVLYREFDLFTGNSLTPGGETFISTSAVAGTQQDAVVASNGNEFVFGFNDQGEALELEASFNYAPVSQDSSLSVPIGFDYQFQLSDFEYFDAEGELLDHVIIDSLPSAAQGQLLRSGTAISAGETISRTDIENGNITFQTAISSIGSIGAITYRTNDGVVYSSAATISLDAEFTDTLFIGTKGAHSFDGVSWDQQDIVGLGGSDFNLGASVTAEIYHLFDANFDLDAFHVSARDTEIATDPVAQVDFGDIVFSVDGTANIPGIGNTQTGDIILFKLGSPGDYDPNNGTFSVLATVPSGGDVKGVTVVESNTNVGDFELQAGDILFTESSNANDIFRLTFSSGTPVVEKFIDGVSIGISEAIYGLELVESDTTVGGTNLAAGSLLLSFENNENIGGTNIQDNDIANLVLTQTELGSGTSAGTASVFYDSSEGPSINNGGDGDITGISLMVQSSSEVVNNNNAISVDEASSVSILSTALEVTDADNTPSELRYKISSGPTNGQILVSGLAADSFTQQDINDGLVSYQHDGSESSSDTINFVVNDRFGKGTDIVLEFSVNAVNDSPLLALNSGATFAEGTTGNAITSTMLSTTDADDASNQLTYTLDSVPTNGQLFRSGSLLNAGETFTQQDINDGLVTYNHNGSETLSDSFDFTVADGGEDGSTSVSDTFSINVNPVNDEQLVVSSISPVAVAEGNSVTLTGSQLSASDVDNSAVELVYTITSGPSNGQILVNGVSQATFTQQDVNDGVVSYSHNGGETSSDLVSFSVDDGAGVASSTSVNFSVTPVNDEQTVVVTSSPISVAEGNAVALTGTEISANDVDNTATELVYTITGSPSVGQIRVNGVFQSTFTQQDINDGVVTYVHNGSETTADSVTFSVDDGAGTTSSASLNFSITPVNDEQMVVATATPISVNEGSSVSLTSTELAASDVDNTAAQLVYTVTSAPANGVLQVSGVTQSTFTQQDINDGLVTYVHDGGETTSDTVSFSVDDGAGANSAASLSFSVNPVNDEQTLVATATPVSVTEGNSVTLSSAELAASDVDNTAAQLTYTITSAPINGIIQVSGVAQSTFTQQDINDGLVTYNHNGSETTSDTITFSVDDGVGTTSSGSLNFAVAAANDEQVVVATSSPVLVGEGSSVSLTSTELSASDNDNSAAELVYTVTSAPANGIIQVSGVTQSTFTQQDINDGLVAYVHDGSEAGSDTVSFSVDDGIGAVSAASLNFSVTAINDEQSVFATAAPITVNEGNSVALTSTELLASDNDNSAVQLVYTVTSAPGNGVIQVSGVTRSTFTQQDINDGIVTYVHDGGETTSDTVSFSVDDGAGTTSSTSLNFSVASVNDEQTVVATALPIVVSEGSSVSLTSTELSASDVDNAPAELVYMVASAPANGVIQVSGVTQTTFTQQDINDGLVTYFHDGGETTSDSVSFSVDDGVGTASAATLNFSVNPINEAPNLDVLATVSVNEGSVGNTINTTHLSASDVDDSSDQIEYEITNEPANGTIRLNGIELAIGDSFTQQDVVDGFITYDHDGSESGSDQVQLSLKDGLENGVLAQSVVLDFDVASQNDPVGDVNTGFEINTTGEDTYFIADDGNALFGGATEFTYEALVLVENPDTYITLGSYRTPIDTTVGDDAFRLSVDDTGQLSIIINGNEQSSTAVDYRAVLSDGQPHSISLTWQSSDGVWNVIVDGQIVDQGNGFASGDAIRANGAFVFGHEQDSVDGGYEQNNEFKGSVYDIRIWDEAQSAAEVAENSGVQFSSDNIPPGLVANWQFDALQSGTTVADVVSGNNLTLQRVTGFDTSEVLTSLNVDENSTNGTSVGFVVPTDSEFYHDISVDGSFTSPNEPTGGGANDYDEYTSGEFVGAWEVVDNGVDLRGSTWEDSPLGGRALDLTSNVGHGTIQQTLDTVAGQTYTILFQMSGNFEGSETSQTLNVNVDGASTGFSFNEPAGWARDNLQWESRSLTFTATSTSTVLQFEGTSGFLRGAIVSDISVISEPVPAAGSLTYSLTNNAGGRFAVDAATGEITVADQSLLDYESDSAHTIQVEVEDEDGQLSAFDLVVEINNLNDAPTVVQSNLSVSEGSSANTITTSEINATDADTTNDQLIYTITSLPANGNLLLDGLALGANETFTQEDIVDGRLTYDHDGSETVFDTIDLRLADGAETQDITFNIDVVPVNDAPILSGTGFSLPNVGQNDSDPTGSTVQNVLDSFTGTAISDSDTGALSGVAVVGVDNTNGVWQYSVNSGATWNSFASQGVASSGTDDANAIFLDNAAMIRFVPASGFNGPAGDLSIRAWDQTDGLSSGQVGNASYSGTSDSVSSNVEAVSITVDFNAAPVANDDSIGFVVHDTSLVITAAQLLSNDTDLENDTLTIVSHTQPSNGVVSVNGDGDFVFTSDSGFSGLQSFDYTVTDGVSNSVGTVSLTVNDIPSVAGESYDVLVDGVLNQDVSGNDSDNFNSGLSYQLVDDVDNGSLVFNGDGTFAYTPAAGFSGSDSFQYRLDDGLDVSSTVMVDIRVSSPPIANDDVVTVNYGEVVQLDLKANDSDVDGNITDAQIQIIVSTDNGNLVLDAGDTIISYEVTSLSAVDDELQYRLMDSNGNLSEVATVKISINQAPDNIVLAGDRVDENSASNTVVGTVSASDLNGDSLSYALADSDADPSNNPFKIDAVTGEISVDQSHLLDFETTPTFSETVIVTDSQGTSSTQNITIYLNPVNEAPEIADLTFMVDEGGRISGDLIDNTTDAENDRFRYHLIDGPDHGSLEFRESGKWEYTHDDSENFVDTFTVAVRDDHGNVSQSIITINVNPVDDTPVSTGDNFRTVASTTVDLDVLENDQNIKLQSQIEIVTQPTKGDVRVNSDGTVSFHANATESGTDFFEYRVSVDGQSSTIARAVIDISPVAVEASATSISDLGRTSEVTEESSVLDEDKSENDSSSDSVDEVNVEELLPGQILNNRLSENTLGQKESNSNSGNFEFLDSQESRLELEVRTGERSILWQPRYAIYGDQIAVEASLNDLTDSYELNGRSELEELTDATFVLPQDLIKDLDEQGINNSFQFSDIPILGFSASSMLTVGAFVWAVRAGALVSTFVSIPAWTQFDPLPVIEKGIPVNSPEDDDSLEKLVDTI